MPSWVQRTVRAEIRFELTLSVWHTWNQINNFLLLVTHKIWKSSKVASSVARISLQTDISGPEFDNYFIIRLSNFILRTSCILHDLELRLQLAQMILQLDRLELRIEISSIANGLLKLEFIPDRCKKIAPFLHWSRLSRQQAMIFRLCFLASWAAS